MAFARLVLLAIAAAVFAHPAAASDPRPPQLRATFLAFPAPIVQYGSTKLVYEMLVTNFSKRSYVFDSVEAKAGAAQFSFSGTALAGMMAHLGPWDPVAGPESRAIAAGKSLVVYFLLDLGPDKAPTPTAIDHTLHVIADDGGTHDISLRPLPVMDEKAIVVAPPLRGVWIAGDAVNNGPDAAHRKTILITDGVAWLAQRYAIDWVQIQKVDGAYATWKGAEDKNEGYFCYDQPIYSVASGKVVGMADGLPENVPHSGKYAVELTFDNAGGNHVVVEIAPHRFVLYAHMKPGTVRVRVGDTVGVGDVVGRVGNSGSSAEPHLHMHIVDHPSFLAGNGMPYEFTAFEASGPVEADVSSPGAISFGPIGPQKPFTDDYPANNAEVTFR
jgi:Peptidase family M23